MHAFVGALIDGVRQRFSIKPVTKVLLPSLLPDDNLWRVNDVTFAAIENKLF